MGLFDIFRKKSAPAKDIDGEKLRRVKEALEEKTRRNSIRVIAERGGSTDIFDSKFGGLPYFPAGMEYPVDEHGDKLQLLAQINFDRMDIAQRGDLPEGGMLQFFVAADDFTGVDFDRLDIQKNFRVIYHESVDYSVTEASVRAIGIPSLSEDTYFPVPYEYKLSFESVEDFICADVYFYEDVLREVCDELIPDAPESDDYGRLTEDEFYELMDSFCFGGHKLLGYPHFTQNDPRGSEEYRRYDTLLLQIDSEDDIMWGDCGVAGFFINSADLKKRDFSKVLYSWDCC